jgi:peptidoglycan/LPS O-acetylase OafA/YrhL
MESPNRTYVAELDQLRGIAALLVFYYHALHGAKGAAGYTEWLTSQFPPLCLVFEGHTGVALFMVLSGFVLARGTFGRPLNYGQFLKNRTLRIFPLMTFVVVFGIYGSSDYSLSGIIAPFLLLTNTSISFNDQTFLSGSVWTIAVEFQFYLIAPFLFAFVSKQGFRYLLLALTLVFFIKLIVLWSNHDKPASLAAIPYYTIVGRLTQFLIGIGLAYWFYGGGRPLSRRVGLTILIPSLLGVLAFVSVLNQTGGFWVWHPWRVAQQEIEGLVWAGVIAGYTIARPFDLNGTRWWGSALAAVGLISFSIYILHWPMLNFFRSLYEYAGPDLMAAVAQWVPSGGAQAVGSVKTLGGVALVITLVFLPLVLAVSALSYYCVERPFLRLRGRYLVDAPNVVEVRQAAA